MWNLSRTLSNTGAGLRHVTAGCFALLLLSAGMWAQFTLSTVRGLVTDPGGAAVPGARIELVNVDTNEQRKVNSNGNGDFEIPDLQRGTYRLTGSHEGFKGFVVEGIQVNSAEVHRVNVAFEMGATTAEITVTAGAAVIQTDASKIQNNVDVTKHIDVPLIGGNQSFNPSMFITTAPLVSQTTSTFGSSWAGQNSAQVQEGQDGHTNDGPVNQINNILDVQEVTVTTVNNSAEYSRVGYLNLVTKSGGNRFHGTLAYFHQNSAFGTRSFFEAKKAKSMTHTSSVGISGPIIRNKTFFYTSGNILRIPGKTFYIRDVPTDLMRQGDFSQLLAQSKPTIVSDPLTKVPFAGNIIPVSRINPLASAVNQSYLPAANRGVPGALSSNYGYLFPYPDDYSLRRDFTQRVDHQVTGNNRLMGRVVEGRGYYVLSQNFPDFTWTRKRVNLHVVVEDTHIFSAAIVNTARGSFSQEKVVDGDTVYGVTPFKGDEAVKKLGLQGVNPSGASAEGFPIFTITGYPVLKTQAGGTNQNDHNWGYADTLTWSKGRHVLKFGAEFKPQSRYSALLPDGSYGSFAFNGSFSGYGYADLLLGVPFTSSRLDPLTKRTTLDSELGIFVTDTFKVGQRLTLDLGIRWDRFGSPNYSDGLLYNWDPVTGNVIVPQDTLSRVSPLYPKTIAVVGGDARQHPDEKNFVPRIGFAYRITDKWVIRGGYGMFTETLGRFSRLSSSPFQITETYQNAITAGVPLFTLPNPFPSSLASAQTPSQSVAGFTPNTHNGNIHQYNFSTERQIKNVGLRFSYVGSHNYGFNYSLAINKPAPSLIPFTAARQPYPQFNGTSVYRSNGEAKFNAFNVEATRKAGQLTFDTHWTWASSFSNYQGGANLENPAAALQYARDALTPRHRGVLNVAWEIPVGKGRRYLANTNALVNGALGGWQLYWIGYLETGHYFTPTFSGSDPSHTNTSGGFPDRTCNGNLPTSQRTITHWFDSSCFAVPPSGRLGNAGAFVAQGPGYNMQNISVAKAFPITERWKFTFTAVSGNILNHPNFALPASNVSAANVGIISSLVSGTGGRQLELRGRIEF